jgi:hypothetical protein
MKATGEGFSLEPQKIEIEFESELPVRCLEPADPACFVAPVLFSDGLVACTVACMSEFELVIEKGL